jgi:hypothetical protein
MKINCPAAGTLLMTAEWSVETEDEGTTCHTSPTGIKLPDCNLSPFSATGSFDNTHKPLSLPHLIKVLHIPGTHPIQPPLLRPVSPPNLLMGAVARAVAVGAGARAEAAIGVTAGAGVGVGAGAVTAAAGAATR